jgi:hypothetical protein
LITIVDDEVGQSGCGEALDEGLKIGFVSGVLRTGWRDDATTLNEGLEWVIRGEKILEKPLDYVFRGLFDRVEELLFDG